MTATMAAHEVELGARVGIPGAWPDALAPSALERMDTSSPFLAVDLEVVRDRLRRFRQALPGIQPFYAVKCNPAPEILSALGAEGSGFEIASRGELRTLQALGVEPAGVLYSNPVKPAAHISEAARAGVWRFAFDSESELRKLARCAPGAAVYVRLRVEDADAAFPLSRKFGVAADEARTLLRLARDLGLRAYGVTFHVGSQCTAPLAWRRAISVVGRLLSDLLEDGIVLRMLDMGGGFPARYGAPVPAIELIGATIDRAVAERLPYRPALLAAEPGRHLVAEAGVLVATVIGRVRRGGEDWLHLDVGAYNGLMEAQQTGGRWPFPLRTSRDDEQAPRIPFTVTGPTCDSSDTVCYDTLLPASLDEGDRVYVGSTGAYTLSYASSFNGFPPPEARFVGA